MKLFPIVTRVTADEARVLLPDVQVEIYFYCTSGSFVAASTIVEVSRISTRMCWGSLPTISEARVAAARRLAVEAIMRFRNVDAQRQIERFQRPVRRLV